MKSLVRFLALLVLAVFLPAASHAADAPAAEGKAVDGKYTRVHGQKYKYDGKAVEVVEFLSFGCGHCYAFEKSIPVIKGNFPKKVKWKVVPVYWGNGSSKPGEAYLLAEEAGKGDEMKKALFNANFVEKKNIATVEVLEELALKIGLGFDFSMKLRSGEKADEVNRGIDKARSYGVGETPSLIIAGNILTSPRDAGGDMDAFRDNVIAIVKSVLKQ